jgi:hypothetical protein
MLRAFELNLVIPATQYELDIHYAFLISQNKQMYFIGRAIDTILSYTILGCFGYWAIIRGVAI